MYKPLKFSCQAKSTQKLNFYYFLDLFRFIKKRIVFTDY